MSLSIAMLTEQHQINTVAARGVAGDHEGHSHQRPESMSPRRNSTYRSQKQSQPISCQSERAPATQPTSTGSQEVRKVISLTGAMIHTGRLVRVITAEPTSGMIPTAHIPEYLLSPSLTPTSSSSDVAGDHFEWKKSSPALPWDLGLMTPPPSTTSSPPSLLPEEPVAPETEAENLNNENDRPILEEEFFLYQKKTVIGGRDWIDIQVALKNILNQLSMYQCKKDSVEERKHEQNSTSEYTPDVGASITSILYRNLKNYLGMIARGWVEVHPGDLGKPLEKGTLPWSHFEDLVYMLKEVNNIKDFEVEGRKFTLKVRPIPNYKLSFRPLGAIALNQVLLRTLRRITGPIQVQGKCPIKLFDARSRKDKNVELNELQYKLQMSEMAFDTFMQTPGLRKGWEKESGNVQRRICKKIIDSLTSLFLYWGWYFHNEGILTLPDDGRNVKKAFTNLFAERLWFLLERNGDPSKNFPYVNVYGRFLDENDAEEGRRASVCEPNNRRGATPSPVKESSKINGRNSATKCRSVPKYYDSSYPEYHDGRQYYSHSRPYDSGVSRL